MPHAPSDERRLAQSTARTYFTMLLLGIAALVALTLGIVGIYGVTSYIVSLRTREIALRLALGARPAAVRWMVSRQAVALAALGATRVATRLIRRAA